MTKETAVKLAKEDMTKRHCVGYVVIHYDTPSAFQLYFAGKEYTPDIDYDFILFSTTDDLLDYCHGKYAHDYLDTAHILGVGESISAVYSTDKIIIL